jgi:hypothetical protein
MLKAKMVLFASLFDASHIKSLNRVSPDYAADSFVPLLKCDRNPIEKVIGSSTMFVDNGQISTICFIVQIYI